MINVWAKFKYNRSKTVEVRNTKLIVFCRWTNKWMDRQADSSIPKNTFVLLL